MSHRVFRASSDLVRIDLQAALQRSIQTLHLPVHQLPDELVKMKVFVPQGVTCFSSETFDCTSPFEYWQKALTDEGRRVYPRKNSDTMISHRVHKSIEEICPVFEPSVKHFILGDTNEQAHIRTVIFALFTARYEFIGACHWIPITKMWDILDLCGGDHGSSTTTIGGSHIGMWKLTKVISLPVMREVTATLCLWTKGCFRAVTRSGLRTDPPPSYPQPVTLQATPSRKRPRHLKAQRILCYL